MPACLAVGEATWVTLLVNASYNAPQGPRVRLPFLAFAVPAIGAVAAVAATERLRWRWWKRGLLVGAVALVGATVTAGCTAALTVPGSAFRIATLPWTTRAHRVATVAGAAWLVAIAAWARGAWLGLARPRFTHAARSAAISATAFVGIFAGRAAARDVAFRAATGDAGVMLLVFFPLTATALLLIRQREIEAEVLLRTSSGPGLPWLSVLGAPLLVLAGASVAVAAVARPAARGVGRSGLAVLLAIGWAFAALGRLLSSGGHASPNLQPPAGAQHLPTAPLLPVAPHTQTVPTPVWVVLAVLAGGVALWVVVRYVRPLWPRRWRPPKAPDVDEERDSVFTWAHFGAQLTAGLRRVLRRLRSLLRRLRRRRVALAGAASPVAARGGAGVGTLEGIRADYRRVLLAARWSGSPRAPAETANEFGQRLADGLPGSGALSLGDLTGLYQRVRYGDAVLTEPERERGRQAAAAVVEGLVSTTEDRGAGLARPGPA